uniref:Uncharacterized protein n=1 Tax=Rhizophora mucronata TaxID=61149 RepID=A0A2P2MTH0_RHIMU
MRSFTIRSFKIKDCFFSNLFQVLPNHA